MSHSYVQNVVHVVFSTKERRAAIPAEFGSGFGLMRRGYARTKGFLCMQLEAWRIMRTFWCRFRPP